MRDCRMIRNSRGESVLEVVDGRLAWCWPNEVVSAAATEAVPISWSVSCFSKGGESQGHDDLIVFFFVRIGGGRRFFMCVVRAQITSPLVLLFGPL